MDRCNVYINNTDCDHRVQTTIAAGPAEPYFCEAALANQLAECEKLGNVVHCAEAAVPALVPLLSKAAFVPNRTNMEVTAHVSDGLPVHNGTSTSSQR